MKNRKIVLISVVTLIFVIFAVISFCVIVPQKTPATGSTYGSDIMIDKTQPEASFGGEPEDSESNNTENDDPVEENENDNTIQDGESSDEEPELNGSTGENKNNDSPSDEEISDETENETNAPVQGESGSFNENEQPSDNYSEDDVNVPSDEISSSETSNPFLQNLNFFVNEKAITKTKQVSGNVTTFEISFRVFVLNNSTGTKTISINAFSADYIAGNSVLYYTTICDTNASSAELDAYESADFGFTLKYIVLDTENFDLNKTNNLTISYMFNEVISLNI